MSMHKVLWTRLALQWHNRCLVGSEFFGINVLLLTVMLVLSARGICCWGLFGLHEEAVGLMYLISPGGC